MNPVEHFALGCLVGFCFGALGALLISVTRREAKKRHHFNFTMRAINKNRIQETIDSIQTGNRNQKEGMG